MQRESTSRDPLLRTVFTKTVRDQRRAFPWWSLGVVGTVFMYSALYPSVKDSASQFEQYMKNLPEAIQSLLGSSFTEPAGYLQSEFFSLLGPILFLVYAIGAGARALAGEEEGGTLDLLLSTPLSRRRMYLDTFEAFASGTAVLGALAWIAIELLGRPYGLTVVAADLTAAVLNLTLLAIAFGSLAQAIGAATGSKGLAVGMASGIALVTFLVNTLAVSVHALGPVSVLSPFHYYSSHRPLATGFHVVDVLVLGGIALAGLAGGMTAFERRDLAT